MSLFNRFVFMSQLLKSHLLGSNIPFFVTAAVTPRCNFHCGYCYGQYPTWQTEEFSKEELFTLIDGLAALGSRWITLGGGEPLLRDDIGELIDRVKKNKMECGMNTNGSLIPFRLKELKNIDRITVSFDGPKEDNDANRGSGSFKKIVTGIDAAIKAGIEVYLATVITRYNHKDIDWIVDFAKQKGIQVEFNFLFNQAEGRKDSDNFMADNDSIRKAAVRIADLKAKGAPIKFSEDVYRYVSKWPDYRERLIMNKEPQFDYVPCYAGRFSMFINADGKIYPCVQLIDVFPALDFRQAGVKKAWQNCADHYCKACYFPCWNEYNRILSFNPRVIFGQVKNALKGH